MGEITMRSAKKEKPEKKLTREERLLRKKKKLEKQKIASEGIEEELEELRQRATSTTEKDYLDEYMHLFVTNQRMIRKLERQMLTADFVQQRDVYALSALYSQQREIIADIRSISDMTQQVEMLQNTALTPFASEVTQHVTDVYYLMRKLITEIGRPKEVQFGLKQLDDLVKQLGMGIRDSHSQAQQRMHDILVGPSEPAKKKKRH